MEGTKNMDSLSLINEMLIHREKCIKLSTCLKAYSKEQLQTLALNLRLDRMVCVQHTKKDELLSLVEAEILERLPYIFRSIGAGVFIYLHSIGSAQDHFASVFRKSICNAMFGEDVKYNKDLAIDGALRNGLVYYFQKKENGEIVPSVPEEVWQAMGEYTPLFGKNIGLPGDLVVFRYYTEVLTFLYGVCTPELLMQVYNRDALENARQEKKEVLRFMEELGHTSNVFYFKDGCTVLDEINHESQIKRILEGRRRFEPYIPSPQEIDERISERGYDGELPAYKQLVRLLESVDGKYGGKAAETVCNFMKMECGEKFLLDVLSSDYGIELDEGKHRKFSDLHKKLLTTAHLWTRFGNAYGIGSITENVSPPEQNKELQFFFDRQKEEREKRGHVRLPEDCVVPSKEEIEESSRRFDAYWGNNKRQPDWYKDASRRMSSIQPGLRKHASEVGDLDETVLNRLLDQWLASVWHASANRPGEFGNRKWNYYVFSIEERIGENLFACRTEDGSIKVVYSENIGKLFEENRVTFLAVLIDLGGWNVCYGPIWSWYTLVPGDFAHLARLVASQSYDTKGLSAVIQFNPVLFWIVYQMHSMPPVIVDGALAMSYEYATRFKKTGTIPDELSGWECDQKGKYTRWRKDDYGTVISDTNSGKVWICSYRESYFSEIKQLLEQYLDNSRSSERRITTRMKVFIIQHEKKPSIMTKLANLFADEGLMERILEAPN